MHLDACRRRRAVPGAGRWAVARRPLSSSRESRGRSRTEAASSARRASRSSAWASRSELVQALIRVLPGRRREGRFQRCVPVCLLLAQGGRLRVEAGQRLRRAPDVRGERIALIARLRAAAGQVGEGGEVALETAERRRGGAVPGLGLGERGARRLELLRRLLGGFGAQRRALLQRCRTRRLGLRRRELPFRRADARQLAALPLELPAAAWPPRDAQPWP